jgi:hypothetical protein
MKKNVLLEIERNREIMGLKPLIMEGINLLITESLDLFKLGEKLLERTTETEVEEVVTRNSRIFEIGTEKLEEKIANRGTRTANEVAQEFLAIASRDTEKFLEMLNVLSIELPSVALDLAIKVGENTIPFRGLEASTTILPTREVPIYEVLEKWWEVHGAEVNSVEKFKEVGKKLSESLDIPSDTMNKLREAAMYGQMTGISSSGDAVVDNIIGHFGGFTGEKTLEGVTERELSQLISSITEEEINRFTDDIIRNDSIFMISSDGTLNINSPTLIDHCLNRAPKNIRKYFRTKYKLPIGNLDVPIPFTSVKNMKLVAEELELVRQTLSKMRVNKPSDEIFAEINKHVQTKITPGMWEQAWDKLGCYGESYSKAEWIKALTSFGKYSKDMKTSQGRKAWCFVAQSFVVTFALKVIIVDLGIPLPKWLVSSIKFMSENVGKIFDETKQQIKGTLTAENTDEIELFYKQHEESRDEFNHRFYEPHDNYFEVRVFERKPTMGNQDAVSLSDWKVVIYENGEFTLEDAETWWESIKGKADEKIDNIKGKAGDIKNKADSLINKR